MSDAGESRSSRTSVVSGTSVVSRGGFLKKGYRKVGVQGNERDSMSRGNGELRYYYNRRGATAYSGLNTPWCEMCNYFAPACPNCGGWKMPYQKYRNNTEIFRGNPVTMFIGHGMVRHDIHLDVLSSVSPIFEDHDAAAYFTNPNINIPLQSHPSLAFPMVSTSDFGILMRWLYEGSNAEPRSESSGDMFTLARLWVTCAFIGAYQVQNKILGLIVQCLTPKETRFNIEALAYVYRHTPNESKFRQFLIPLFVQRGGWSHRFVEYRFKNIMKDALQCITWMHCARGRNMRKISDTYGMFISDDGMLPVIDWDNVEFPLPDFLIFDEFLSQDYHRFYVLKDEAFLNAVEMWNRMGNLAV